MKVSIISLIYRSPQLADWVYASVHKFTPMISRGDAEFYFVANDPTPNLLAHLRKRGYQHLVNLNRRYSDDELFALGYGAPEYMSRVYRGYNEGIRRASGDYVVLINSDNYFSQDWLENLLKYSDRSRVIGSTLVERLHPKFGVFPGALHGEFGHDVTSFDEAGFLAFVARAKRTGLEPGGAYMPTLFHRDVAIEAGLYPNGNVAGKSFDEIVRFGDEAFFDRLAALGVSHYTALDSISYHLKEGEREDPAADGDETQSPTDSDGALIRPSIVSPYPPAQAIERVRDSMAPTKRHEALVSRVIDSGEFPRLRTLRQLIASGVLSPAQEASARAEIERLIRTPRSAAEAESLEAQRQRLKGWMARIVGPRHVDRVASALRPIWRLSYPARRFLVHRRHRR